MKTEFRADVMLGGEIEAVFGAKEGYHGAGLRNVVLARCDCKADVPPPEARALLEAHFIWAHDEFRSLGAPDFDIDAHVDHFFDHLEAVLPPRGAYFLARNGQGAILGTAALRRVSEETAEMKHLYVRPDARRTGLGQALIEARIAAARQLGVRTIVADTFKGNEPMIRLYRRLGFSDAGPYESAVSRISPDLIPYLHYFRMTA